MKEEEERTPLRTILQNFLNHIEKLDKEKLEGSYDKEFQELKLFSEFLKTSKQYSCSQGEKEVNRKKNRYKDILPFDSSRVILEDYAGIPGSDYINANYIKGASGSPAYIASQGPLPHTVNDFWRMVVQCEVQVIVMACNEEEAGKHKCENYWVEREGEEKQFGMVAIQLIKASVVCPDFLVRTMRLKYTKNHSTTPEERTVCQFHYSAWPDHGVPPLVRPLLDMVRLVRDTQASETLPVLVHCSAGCGRTGTICAIDYVWGLLRAGKLTRDFSLFKLVREMRKQRIAMVQTKEQYVLVHHAVKELFNEQLRMIDSHPYENIDVNGMVKESPEPLYATITPEVYDEEKQDTNEKESISMDTEDTPPLPCKRKPYTAHTKQEKEVENLTQKHRSSSVVEPSPSSGSSSPGPSSSASSSASSSLLHKPRIAKLRALFERTSNREGKSVQMKHRSPQQVTRSHSLGAVRKVEDVASCIQPIPNRGVLRVPQLSVTSDATYVRSGRPALPIKRSKSLKVLNSGERSKFSVLGLQVSQPPESQLKDTAMGETRDYTCSSKVTIPVSDKSVREEVRPHVPPKKIFKDKVSERKVLKTSQGVTKTTNSQSISSGSKKNEDPLLTYSRLSSTDCWRRRSLDSLPFESEMTASPVYESINQAAKPCSRPDHYQLDDEAQKLFQDCRDYLNKRVNSDASEVPSSCEKSFQDHSVQVDPLSHLAVEAQRKVHSVVTGLGTRQRRNSFRQAISKEPEVHRRICDYESLWPNRTNCGLVDRTRTTVEVSPNVNDSTPSDPPHLRTKFYPKTLNHNSPSQLHNPPARTGKSGKLSVNQKVEHVTSVSHPKSLVDIGVTCGAIPSKSHFLTQNETNASTLYSNVKEGINMESRLVHQLDTSASINTSQTNDHVYLKGEGSNSVRHDLRVSAQTSRPLHCKPHPHSQASSLLGPVDSVTCQNERHIPANASSLFTITNFEKIEQKNMNVSVARKITPSKDRFVVPGQGSTLVPVPPMSMKHPEPQRSDVNNRCAFADMPHNPQMLVVRPEPSRPCGALKEQISIVEESAGFGPRTAEGRIVSSKVNSHSKGERDPHIAVKLESTMANKGAERFEIGSGAVRRVHMLPGSVKTPGRVKPSRPQVVAPQNQDQRLWGLEPNSGGARIPVVDERDAPLAATELVQRNLGTNSSGASAGRLVPKMGLKQKMDVKATESGLAAHLAYNSQDDLALCVGGRGRATAPMNGGTSSSSSSSGGSNNSNSRGRRHASVAFRHSLIESNATPSISVPASAASSAPAGPPTPAAPSVPTLAVRGAASSDSTNGNLGITNHPNVSRQELEAWIGAPGVDVDLVGASIKPSRDHGTPLVRALEAFNFRKSQRGAAVSPPQQRKIIQPQVFVKKQHYL